MSVLQAGLSRAGLFALAAASGMLAAGPAEARCAMEIKSAERAFESVQLEGVARDRARREIAAAKQADSERLCQRHLQAALRELQPLEEEGPDEADRSPDPSRE